MWKPKVTEMIIVGFLELEGRGKHLSEMMGKRTNVGDPLFGWDIKPNHDSILGALRSQRVLLWDA